MEQGKLRPGSGMLPRTKLQWKRDLAAGLQEANKIGNESYIKGWNSRIAWLLTLKKRDGEWTEEQVSNLEATVRARSRLSVSTIDLAAESSGEADFVSLQTNTSTQ